MPQSFGRATMSENHLTLTKAKDGISEKLAVTKDNYKHFRKIFWTRYNY